MTNVAIIQAYSNSSTLTIDAWTSNLRGDSSIPFTRAVTRSALCFQNKHSFVWFSAFTTYNIDFKTIKTNDKYGYFMGLRTCGLCRTMREMAAITLCTEIIQWSVHIICCAGILLHVIQIHPIHSTSTTAFFIGVGIVVRFQFDDNWRRDCKWRTTLATYARRISYAWKSK